jgi:cyclophilin family peptidyl-prolyl cis-trans isomerase
MYKIACFFILITLCVACKQDLRLFGEDPVTMLKEFGKKNPEKTILVTTREGNFTIRLYDDTPLHRANFIRLVKGGFYDERYFYRNVYETAIQGGAGWYGLDYDIPTEVLPNYTHKRGAVSMAQYDIKENPKLDTSSSEFFIVTDTEQAEKFNGIYTVVGEVVSGMEVVDKIKKARAYNEVPELPVKFSMELIDHP